MNQKHFLHFLLAFVVAPSVADMGFGRSAVNLLYVLPYTQVYQIVGDTIIGLIAGFAGLGLLVYSMRKLLEPAPLKLTLTA